MVFRERYNGIAGQDATGYMARDTGNSVLTKIDHPRMTQKEHREFYTALRRMSAFDVRENSDPSVQPDSHKRAMAVTELERRRQARAPDTIRDPVTRRTVSLFFLGILVAGVAAAYWRFF